MKSLNVVFRELIGRKIRQVKGEDDLRSPLDCSGQDVPIIRIGENQRIDQTLMAGHEAVTNSLVHEQLCTL